MRAFEDIYLTNLNAVCNMGGFYSNGDRDWVYNGGRFRQNKFYFITSGACVINIEGTEYRGGAGSWFFIPSNAYHSFYDIKGESFKKYWIHFDVYPDNRIFERLSLPYVITPENTETITEIFSKYAEISQSNNLSDKLFAKGYLTELLAEYIRHSNSKDSFVETAMEERFSELLRYINENLSKRITNSELAAFLFVHPNHLIRIFRERVGKTPSRYIAEKKMEQARRLLETTELSVMQISEKVGISDTAYFARLFKSCYDMTPTYCRKYYKKSWYTDDI